MESSGMESNITLWQFLLELLVSNQHNDIITWTNNEGEFKLLFAEEVAQLWGRRKNKTNMNYDKLSRALRYYYDKNIIRKVLGQKFVYRFVSIPGIAHIDSGHALHMKAESYPSVPARQPSPMLQPADLRIKTEPVEDVESKDNFVNKPTVVVSCVHSDNSLSAEDQEEPLKLKLTRKTSPKTNAGENEKDKSAASAPLVLTSTWQPEDELLPPPKLLRLDQNQSPPPDTPKVLILNSSSSCTMPSLNTYTTTTHTVAKPKPKPLDIAATVCTANAPVISPRMINSSGIFTYPSLQTPIVNLSPSPVYISGGQNKMPMITQLPFWNPLSPLSPSRFSSGGSSASTPTYFQFPSFSSGVLSPRLFFGSAFSGDFEKPQNLSPTNLSSPSKQVSALRS